MAKAKFFGGIGEYGSDIEAEQQTPTAEQLQAVRDFAAKHGKQWKRALYIAWDRDTREQWGELRQVRNTFGPQWLESFRLEA